MPAETEYREGDVHALDLEDNPAALPRHHHDSVRNGGTRSSSRPSIFVPVSWTPTGTTEPSRSIEDSLHRTRGRPIPITPARENARSIESREGITIQSNSMSGTPLGYAPESTNEQDLRLKRMSSSSRHYDAEMTFTDQDLKERSVPGQAFPSRFIHTARPTLTPTKLGASV